MARRPAWKGYVKLSHVMCAVELTNVVTHSEKITFSGSQEWYNTQAQVGLKDA